MVKQYLLSINREIKDLFELAINSIKSRIAEEVFNTPLQSSPLAIKPIIDFEFDQFHDGLVSTLDFYADGIYYSGKVTAKKKLKIETKRPKGQKYDLSQLDQIYLDRFKSEGLNSFQQKMQYAASSYVNQLINNNVHSNLGLDDREYKFKYMKQELVDSEMDELLLIVVDSISSVYNEIVEATTEEVIMLFKRGQIEEYRQIGVSFVQLESFKNESSCPICQTRSNKPLDINDLVSDVSVDKNLLHPFCKVSIEPVISSNYFNHRRQKSREPYDFVDYDLTLTKELVTKIDNMKCGVVDFNNVPIDIENNLTKMFNKIRIYLSDFIKPINFYFVKDVVDTEEWVNEMKSLYSKYKKEHQAENDTLLEQDVSRNWITSFRVDEKVFISNFSLLTESIEDIVVRELMRNIDITDRDWWFKLFRDKSNSVDTNSSLNFKESPFVTSMAEDSVENFILESIVCYINNPLLLKNLDINVYNKIKTDIFNNVEFL